MKYLRPLTLLILLSFIHACASTPVNDIDIETYSTTDIDYAHYKTYAWGTNSQVQFDPIGQWEQPTVDTDQDIRTAINHALVAHKLVQDNENPDLLVTYVAGVEPSTLELKEDPDNDLDIPASLPKAALIVALTDTKTGYVVWLGQAVGNARQQESIGTIRNRIKYAVNEMFQSY